VDRPIENVRLLLLLPAAPAASRPLHQALGRLGDGYRLQEARSLPDVLSHLTADDVDLVLLDADAPAESVERVVAAASGVAIVAITPADDERVGAEAMRRGAHDWVASDTGDPILLRRTIRHALDRRALTARLERAEQEMHARQESLLHVLVNSRDGVLVTDPEGRVLLANAVAETMLERTAAELIGMVTGLPVQEGATPEVEIPRQSGSPATADVRVLPIEWEGTSARLVTLRDCTERKRAERELVQLAEDIYRQSYEVRSFHQSISHELRTPLTVAREFVGLVLTRDADHLEETARQHLELAHEACDQMVVCIADLLDTTRIETGKLTIQPCPTSIGELVQRVVKSVSPTAEKVGVRLSSELAADLPHALVDDVRIRQVLMNLLTNAFKFTPPGGAIVVRAEIAPESLGFVAVSVRDTGCGIEAGELPRIFERHYQGTRRAAKQGSGGLGLGLSICKELVGLHAGKIWVESEVGKGSTFTFTVPLSAARTAAATAAGGDAERPLASDAARL
jgi:signal transduction histidine kinase